MQRQIIPHTIQRELKTSYFSKNTPNHSRFKKYDIKKHKNEMVKANEILEQCCQRNDRQANLPYIFKFTIDKNDNSEMVYSMHLTAAQAEEMGVSYSQHQSPSFAGYIEAMRNAIIKLKRCYCIHYDKNDVTAGVLSYLLCVIEHKLFHSKADDDTVTYITVLEEFVNEFRKCITNADERRYLKEVNRQLRIAKEYLIEQSEAYDLKKSVADMWRMLIWQSNALTHTLVKLVVCEEDRDFVDSTTMDELRQGLLASESMNKAMSSSIFQRWIVELATYYESVIDSKANSVCDQICDPGQLFITPNMERYHQLHASRVTNTSQENNEKIKMDEELNYLLKIFHHSPNFLTRQLDFSEETGESTSVLIEDKNLLVQRIKIMAKIASVIQQMMTLAYLTKHVLNGMSQFHDIQTKIPRYLVGVLNIMDGMCEQISSKINYLTSEFRSLCDEVEYENKTTDPLYVEIRNSFNATHFSMRKFNDQIKLYRMFLINNSEKYDGKPVPESFKYEMISVARMVADANHIPNILKQSNVTVSQPSRKKQSLPRAKTLPVKNKPVFKQNLGELVKKTIDSPNLSPRDARFYDVYFTPREEGSEKGGKAEKVVLPEYTSMASMKNVINQIQKKILEIKNTEKNIITRKELNAYIYLQRCLWIMFQKCRQMIEESGKEKDRADKTEKLYYLVLQFCGITHEFLSLSHSERIENVHVIVGFIKDQLGSDDNDYLDDHDLSFKKYINNSCFKIFGTETREKISYFSEACDLLQDALTPLRPAIKIEVRN